MALTIIEKASQSLAAYFMFSSAEASDMPGGIVLSALLARKESLENSNQLFEQLMLDIGTYCDEKLNVETPAGKAARKNFMELISLLQRVEQAAECINRMVFFARGIPDSDTLNMLLRIWNELNSISPGLFRELLLENILVSDLPGRMGRKRVTHLLEGLESLTRGTGSIQDIQQRLERVEREERILVRIVTTIQDTIGSHYGWVAGEGERETIKRIVSIELRHQRLLKGDIPDNLFDLGLKLAKSSLMYMNTLLPIIVAHGDDGLREEFIRDSGLDRLLVEELEEFWCSRENIPHSRLIPIRSTS
jgi:uncharacterized protein (TIGR04442 family)